MAEGPQAQADATAGDDTVTDRSKDIPPPAHGDMLACECGKRMIARVDHSTQHQGYMRWYWWCGCGKVKDGGTWHPLTAEESAAEAWERANEGVGENAAVEAGRIIPVDCKHEHITVADGGWTCDDCGKVGSIAPIDDHMHEMPAAHRRDWERVAEKLQFWGFTREQWDAWRLANPTAAEVLADVEAASGGDPEAGADKLAAAVIESRPGMANPRLAHVVAQAFLASQ